MVKIAKKVGVLIITILFSTIHSGCSFFVPSHDVVSVITSEEDAQIFINGNLVGRGTAQASVKKNRSVSIMAKKEGFYPATRVIGTMISPTGALDIIGGILILVPFAGLMAPGAWKLEENNISLVLMQK